MKRPILISFLVFLLALSGYSQKISSYGNTNTPASNDLFILATRLATAAPTNANISYGQLSNQIRSSIIQGVSITNGTIYGGYISGGTNQGNFQVPAGSTITAPGFILNPTVANATKGIGKYLTDVDGSGTMVWTNLVDKTDAGIVYVSPWGNDATAVKSRRDKPWQTLSNAIVASANGDTIWLLPGVHTNGGNARWAATAKGCATNYYKVNLSFIGEANPVLYFPTGHNCVIVNRSKNILFDGITFMNEKSEANLLVASNWVNSGQYAGAITIVDSTNITVRNCTFTNLFGSGVHEPDYLISFNSTNGIVIENSKFYNTGLYCTQWPQGIGAGIWACGGWKMQRNHFEDCSIGIMVRTRYNIATMPRSPVWYAINNSFVNCCYSAIWAADYNQDGGFVIGNTILRTTNELTKAGVFPAGNAVNNSCIYLIAPQNVLIVDNYIDGGYRGLHAAGSSVSEVVITNLMIANNEFFRSAYMACLIEDHSDGVQISGNSFSEEGQYGVFMGKGGNPDWHLNTRVLNNNFYGFNVALGSGSAFSWKFTDLISNLWFDGNMAFGLTLGAVPLTDSCFFLHTIEGFTTNVYVGNNTCANCETNYLWSTTTTPIWTQPYYLIETNLVDPPSIAANSSWVTNISTLSLSLTAADDAVSVGAPSTWQSAAAGTNLMVTAFASGGAVVLSILNGGPAACDPPSAIVKITVAKSPSMWPGSR